MEGGKLRPPVKEIEMPIVEIVSKKEGVGDVAKGETIDVSEARAERWIANGIAKAVGGKKPGRRPKKDD